MPENSSFFADFEPASKEKWYLKALKEMKSANADEQLIWKPIPDLKVQPLYTKEDLFRSEHLKRYQHGAEDTLDQQQAPRYWAFRQKIYVGNHYQEANAIALQALAGGANGIEFHLDDMLSYEALEVLMQKIPVDTANLSFYTKSSPMQFLCLFRGFVRENGYELTSLRGSLAYTYLGTRQMGDVEMSQVLILGSEMPHFKVFPISGVAGLDAVADIASMLGNFIFLAEKMSNEGLTPSLLAREVEFRVKTGNFYFVEIAKMRALRMLFTELARQIGVQDFQPHEVRIHATTTVEVSERTQKDVYWNLLANTNQAMAAVLGGCNSLTILPHTHHIEAETEFARRMARNISNILKEEAHFDKVADPAAGSYYIENLTDQIAEKAWNRFRENYCD